MTNARLFSTIFVGVLLALVVAYIGWALLDSYNKYDGVAEQTLCEQRGNPVTFCERLYGR